MRLLLSCPTGFNTREILHPLSLLLNTDSQISDVLILTPAADYASDLFSEFHDKYQFFKNPASLNGHIQLFQELKPDLILTPTAGLDFNDTPILRAGKTCHIPTMTFVASWDNVFKMERMRQHNQNYELADYFAVWNQMNADHLHRAFPSIPQSHIRITGAPRFDFFHHHGQIPSREELLNHIGFTDTSKHLIHAATTELYPFSYILKDLRTSTLSPQFNIYASVHPGGNMDKHHYQAYDTITQYSFGRRAEAPLKEFLYFPTFAQIYMHVALFKYSDILINQSSTVAIESMIADTPVINVKYGQPYDWWKWRRSMVYRDFKQHYRYITDGGGTSLVHNRHQLLTAVQTYFTDRTFKSVERSTTAQKLLTYTDGSASQRLLDYIKSI